MPGTSQSITWAQAIKQALSDGEELHYRDVTARIDEQGLREITGNNPEGTVNKQLNILAEKKEVVVVDRGRGVYRLRLEGEQYTEVQATETSKQSQTAATVAYRSYGRFWRRDIVDWTARPIRLWGRHYSYENKSVDASQLVDFANQTGVYVLHWHGQVMYVGESTKQPFLDRLTEHAKPKNKGARWDTFSWFGFREVVQPPDYLGDLIPEIDGQRLIKYVEGVLIETLLPPLNKRAGDHFGSLYQQVSLSY